MKAKIDSAKAGRTFQGNEGMVQVYEVVAGGVVYDCLSEKILTLIGQEVDFEVKQPSNPKYHPTMKLPKAGGGGGKWGGGKSYTVAFSQTAEGEKARMRSMVLAYAKDIALKLQEYKPSDLPDILKNVKTAYDDLLRILDINQIQEPKQPAPAAGQSAAGSMAGNGQQPSGSATGNGHKSLATLLEEMKALVSLEALGSWWNTKAFGDSFHALSVDDQKAIIAAKDLKKDAFTKPAGTDSYSQRKPGF